MKKTTPMKIITFLILIIAAVSLIFWSFIMILGNNNTENPNENISWEEFNDINIESNINEESNEEIDDIIIEEVDNFWDTESTETEILEE